jgi:hypothetical protein
MIPSPWLLYSFTLSVYNWIISTCINSMFFFYLLSFCSVDFARSRIKFLLDILTNIHSNNDLRLLSLDEKQHLQHLHKLLKVYTKGK